MRKREHTSRTLWCCDKKGKDSYSLLTRLQTDLCSVNITPNPSSYNNNKIVQNFQIASQNEDNIFLGSFTSYNLPPPEKKELQT